MARKTSQIKRQSQKLYTRHQDVEFATMEYAPDFTLSCPKCDKRAIDVSGRPELPIKLRYKCPNCGNIVVTPVLASRSKTKHRLS